jgi:Arc/MetJ-type ribon-helix-helix transcriptional regulator
MPRRTIRLTSDTDGRLQSTAKLRGYANPSAFVRAAIDNELSDRETSWMPLGIKLFQGRRPVRGAEPRSCSDSDA